MRSDPAPSRGSSYLLFAYFLSGSAALGYQILWARWLSLQFGVSNLGVLLAVVAFLLGLGLGSAWGLRRIWDPRSGLRAFVFVELGVAAYMLMAPMVAAGVYPIIADLAKGSDLGQWLFIQGGVAVVMLTLPALALGYAFTALVQGWRAEGAELHRLYGWNTLGGVVGALAPLIVLPTLGWHASLWVFAGIGLMAAVVGAWMLRGLPLGAERSVVSSARGRLDVRPLGWYGLVGVGAIMLEIAWARLFGLVFLRTEYVMGVILAVYLAGIGLGSLAAMRLRGAVWLSVLPLGVAAAALGSLASVGMLGAWVEGRTWSGLLQAVVAQGVVLFVVMVPVTFILGLWLPLLARRMGDDRRAGPALYAANSVGGAIGALLAGLLVVPWAGTTAAGVVAAGVLLAAGLALAPQRWAWVAALPLPALAVPLWSMPEPAELLPRTYQGARTLLTYEDAVSITHVVSQPSGERLLLSDLQRMDASTEPQAVAGQRNQVRLPLLLHPAPKRVLLLGLGTGISASAALALPDVRVTAVELSRGAIEAADRLFSQANLGVMQYLQVVNDDVRHFLLADDDRYDVIVGDLFHPDLVGRSALLSVQQFRRVRERLAPGGVFVQWLTLNQFDTESLQTVLRSFARVFPDGRLFLDGFRLALMGGRQAPLPAVAMAVHERDLDPRRFAFLTGGEGRWTWLGRYWGTVADLPPGPVQDEWAPRIEYQLPRARFAGQVDVRANLAWLQERRPGAAQAATALGVKEASRFMRAYRATDLALRGFLAALSEDPASDRWIRLAYETNPDDRWVATAYAQRLLDTLPQARRRGLDEARALDRILAVRADFVPALQRRLALAQERGERDLVQSLAARIRVLDPYGAASRAVQVPMLD